MRNVPPRHAQFASRNRADQYPRGNSDPAPWVTDDGGRLTFVESLRLDISVALTRRGMVAALDPRPEFDHPQHNEPNPVLVDFRVVNAGRIVKVHPTTASLAGAWAGMLSDPDCIQFRNTTDAERDHARRVLFRLALLAQVEERP